jgi:DNA-binding MarR family transcriptional regulator
MTARPPSAFALARRIGLCRRLLLDASSRALEAKGVSFFDWQVLFVLAESRPSTQRDLAARLGQHEAGVSRLLATLERRSLIRRIRDGQDRRRNLVEVTAAGRRLMRQHQRSVEAAVGAVLAPLDPERRSALDGLLRTVISAAERRSEGGTHG